ncbi:hypothetical protein D3C71_1302300 [compost metagenome]
MLSYVLCFEKDYVMYKTDQYSNSFEEMAQSVVYTIIIWLFKLPACLIQYYKNLQPVAIKSKKNLKLV